jgi:CO/xanthine dehydrogenase Mo-binding subunit
MPGVVKVVTAKDVPGLNRHGLILKDQPVFCDQEVRYRGDTLAAVVATSPEIAAQAAKLVKVKLRKLPELMSAGEALQKDAPVIHEGGNLAARYAYTGGDAEEAFQCADVVIEETYLTPYQEHAYLETEGGLARPLPDDGGVEIWEGCQNGNRAAADVALILGIPAEKVIVHSYPLGGGFGGKDDLTLQGILAVCALACQKPVQISFSREESFLVSPKRMPMEIHIKMAASMDGSLLANRVRILGTCGAYACYGPAILSLALEHACGFYLFPHVDVEGMLAYTNNSLVSAFRGFGNVQINFAVESMMDMLAEKLGMDPVAFRRQNALKPGVRTSYGYLTARSVYADAVLKGLEESSLWKQKDVFREIGRAHV